MAFVDVSKWDYHLAADLALIDRGAAMGVDTDVGPVESPGIIYLQLVLREE